MYSVSTAPIGGHQDGLGTRIWKAILVGLRLILPVTVLSFILAVCFIEMEEGVTALDLFPPQLWQWNPGYWLTVGHVMLPLAFLVQNLTNRRFGPGYALGQVILTWAVLGSGALYVMMRFGEMSSESPFPPMQTTTAFLGAFFVAQLVNIRVFDRTRGRTWWGAPLISTIWASAIYVVIFYPVSMMGLQESFVPRMTVDFVIKLVSAFVLLVPYFLLRPVIKAAPGYGGA